MHVPHKAMLSSDNGFFRRFSLYSKSMNDRMVLPSSWSQDFKMVLAVYEAL
jgi:hypothetical protein